jgi:hypothetical protein
MVIAGACVLGACNRSDSVATSQPTIPDSVPANTSPAATAPATTPASQAADETLLTKGYIAMGMPSPDHPWSAQEMQSATETLELIAADNPAQLPRLNSKRSGEMFARFIATENYEHLRSSADPILGRMRQLDEYVACVIKMAQTYIKTTKQQNFAADEVVELDGVRLRMVKLALELFDHFFATLSLTQQNSTSGQNGVDRIRRNLRDTTQIMMDTLGDNDYGIAPRLKLVSLCREAFPLIFSHMLAFSQQRVIDELMNDPALSAMSPQLKLLRDDLQATTRPAAR